MSAIMFLVLFLVSCGLTTLFAIALGCQYLFYLNATGRLSSTTMHRRIRLLIASAGSLYGMLCLPLIILYWALPHWYTIAGDQIYDLMIVVLR